MTDLFEGDDFAMEIKDDATESSEGRAVDSNGTGAGSPVHSGGSDAGGSDEGSDAARSGGSKTGVIGLQEGISNEVYHRERGISSSALKYFRESPELYRAKMAGEVPRKDTGAFTFGSAYHKLVLETADFFDEFVISEKFNRRTNAGKAAAAEFSEANEGKQIITEEDYSTMQAMRGVLMAHPVIVDYELFQVGKGKPELSGYYTDPVTGLMCKYRPDWRTDWCIADLKTAASASDAAFKYQSAKFGYEISAAHYIEGDSILTGTDHDQFIFVVQEKEPPYLVNVKVLGPKTLELGRSRRRNAINGIADCRKSGNWPHFNSNTATFMEYPDYNFKEMDQ